MRFSKVGIAKVMYLFFPDVNVKSQVIGSIIVNITTEIITTITTTITSQRAVEVEQCEMPPPLLPPPRRSTRSTKGLYE